MPKSVKLSKPIQLPAQPAITHIKLRDPKFQDFIDIGPPSTWVYMQGGGFEQVTESVVAEWIERLHDGDPNHLLGLDLRDTLKIREAILSFFREATAPETPLPTSEQSPASSSSGSDSTQQPSTI
jgi:hypothetical protein